MILSVFSSYPIPPRLIKISGLYGNDVVYISWNRKKYSLNQNDTIIEETFDDSQSSKIKQYLDIFKFRSFLKHKIKECKPELLICRNWRTFLIVRTIGLKDCRLIYDVCDVPNHWVVRIIEKILINRQTEILLASRFFKPYYKKESQVLENRISALKSIPKIHSNNKLRIIYLGVVRYTDNLLNLIKACDLVEGTELNIYGYGDSTIVLKEYIDQHHSKAVLHGEYREKDIPVIYSKGDVVWCAYPYKLSNVKIAISNKYFETIAFRTPGIFSEQTLLGNLVNEKGIGFTVDPYRIDNIRNLFEKLYNNRDEIREKEIAISNCGEKTFWEDYKEELMI